MGFEVWYLCPNTNSKGISVAKRISIINFKGGVGKTTLSFHLATGLARGPRGKKVLLVDMDHQSSLSVLCLGAEDWSDAVDEKRTVTEIFEWLVGTRTRRPSDEIITRRPLTSYPRLDIIPSSLRLDDLEIRLTTSQEIRLVSNKMGSRFTADWDKRTAICRWIEGTLKTRIDDEYDYVIFDCPPATKVVSQNAIAASHGYIVPIIPEPVMHWGLPHLVGHPHLLGTRWEDSVMKGIDDMIYRQSPTQRPRERRGHGVWIRNTKFAGLVVTSIKSGTYGDTGWSKSHAVNITALQRLWGNYLIKPFITETNLVDDAHDDGVPIYNLSYNRRLRDGYIDETYARLVKAIKVRIDNL